MELADEIKAMNELSTRAPGTEAPGTDSPSTSSPATEAPSTSGPTTEAPVEEDKFDKLYQKIAELESKLVEKKKPATSAPSTEAPIDEQDFLSGMDEDLYDTLNDKSKLNKLLNAVYQAGVKTSRSQTSESVLRQIPSVVRNNVETYVVLTEATRKFYDENPDLKPYAKQVAEVYESVAGTSPEKTIAEVFGMLGDEARTRLKLQKAAVKPAPPNLPPGTKGKRAGGQSKPELSGMMAEIEAMNKMED
jgi:hypothetical protein